MEEGEHCACSRGAHRTELAFPGSWGLGGGWNLRPANPSPRSQQGRITVAHTTYESPNSVRALLRRAAAWPKELASRVDLMLVEDGGTPGAAETVRDEPTISALECGLAVVTLLRDVGFNNGGARNTACLAARTATVCLFDQDFGLSSVHL